MKILYSHHAFCMQRYGGISRYFAELFLRISAGAGVSTEVVAPIFDNEYLLNARKASEFRGTILGVHLPTLPASRLPFRALSSLLSGSIASRIRGVDIFHQTYYSLGDYAPPTARRILTVFDMIHELYPGDFRGRDRTREAKRASVARADHIICISHSTRSDLVRLLGVSASKISVVHLAGGLGAAAPSPPAGSQSGRSFLLYVGQRHGYKNFHALLSQFAATPSLRSHYNLVCFGGGEFSAIERASFATSNIDASQVVHRSGDDQVLAGLYARAAAFVYPSLYEGFGIPPLESMAAGCPVVCAKTSSLTEVVGDAAELFDPEEPDCIALALRRVLEHPSRRAELVAKGFERAREFSWERCALETLEIYQKVLAQ